MKKLVKAISLLISLSLFVGSFAVVSADNDKADNEYIITYVADEVNDTKSLIAMAESGEYSAPHERQLKGRSTKPNDKNTVYQLLERRQYKSGDIEEQYVATTLITGAMTSENAISDNTGGIGNTVAKHKFYYSSYLDGDVYTGTYYIKPQKISTTIVQKGVGDSIYFDHMYNVSWQNGVYELENSKVVSSPSLNTEYALSVTSAQYVPNVYTTTIYSGCTLYVNGLSTEIWVYV